MRRFQRSEPKSRDVPAPPRAPGNLPSPLNQFTGRRTEAARLRERAARNRLVTVTGVGGIGKTRLALHCAERMQKRFCNGVWMVDLSELRDTALLDHTVVEALELADNRGVSPRSVLLNHLARREMLIVLDGFEQLDEEVAALADELLRRSPGLRILAAGRRPVGLTGEHLFPLGPMSPPEAADLFTERAGAVLPGFTARGPRREAVTELCRRLDGIPLALELAAGRLRALSVEQLAQRLDDRFGLLTGNGHQPVSRHRTLRTAIGWSHELCSPRERLLWARLSVFDGDFDLEAAEYLCAGGDLHAAQVLPVLAELVAQSVVLREEREGADGQARYRLLDTVREYGAGWLAELDETERLRRRHRDWYLGLATWCELDWFSPRQADVVARIEQELPNLRLALEYSLENQDEAHIGQYLAATLWFYWLGCGRLAEGRQWLDRALALEGDQPEARAKALWVSGLTAVVHGEAATALGALHECLQLAEAHGDESALAYATQTLGALAVADGDTALGKGLLAEALERFRALGELNTLVIVAQLQLAMAHAFEGDLTKAAVLSEEAREISADSGERWALSYTLYVLAHVRLARGEPGRARALSVAGLTVKRELGDVLGMVLALEQLAALTVGQRPERAAELLGAAQAGWQALGARYAEGPGAGPVTDVPVGAGWCGAWRAGDSCRRRALDALGEAAYDAAWLRGAQLGVPAVAAREVDEHGRAAPELPAGHALRGGSGGGRAQGRSAADTRQPACPPAAGAEGGQQAS
ncbi:regulator [Streptomyces sp. N2-109]|uniref:Regulator n=1 Tax=Streptomyces gossypii TaxID=2883101 RepID=A0ABT2JMH0_9ACTN|nr:regulator [Streptomyces gossypii]MCT2588565.1 regulator [Streptomyces gossypii]